MILGRSQLVSTLLCVAMLGGWLPPPATAAALDPDDRPLTSPAAATNAAAPTDTSAVPTAVEQARDAQAATATADLPSSLEQARGFIHNGDYNGAIQILKRAIESPEVRTAALRDAYLLLIMCYVYLGNFYIDEPQGLETALLHYEEARKRITECLGIKELRHVRPEQHGEYPVKMISLFAEVRAKIFGSFRVVQLEPPHAMVILDGDTLGTFPGGTLPGDVDIAIGQRQVVVRANGYKDRTEEITISPNSTSERPYRLARKRGRTWYATVGTGALALVGGTIALVAGGKSGGTAALEPLPGPPPPPSR